MDKHKDIKEVKTTSIYYGCQSVTKRDLEKSSRTHEIVVHEEERLVTTSTNHINKREGLPHLEILTATSIILSLVLSIIQIILELLK